MFQAVSPPIIRSSKIVHTVSSICRACLLLPNQASATYTGCCVNEKVEEFRLKIKEGIVDKDLGLIRIYTVFTGK
jgi:hypothetical protein